MLKKLIFSLLILSISSILMGMEKESPSSYLSLLPKELYLELNEFQKNQIKNEVKKAIEIAKKSMVTQDNPIEMLQQIFKKTADIF